jgi:hypothetical protein
MEKISPLHVSDATIVIAAGCHGCGGTVLVDYGWMPHNASFGFLDMPRPTLGQIQIHFLDRL